MTLRTSSTLFLAACGAALSCTTAANAQLNLDTSDRNAVATFYRTWFTASNRNVTPNWTGATTGCDSGSYDRAYRDALLNRINAYRALASVANVSYEESSTFGGMDEQRAALLLKTSGQIGQRTLSRRTPCWTQDADRALLNSYQAAGVGTDSVDASMRGATSPYNQSLILQPTTIRVRVGSTDGELLINRPDTQDVFPNTGSVAWPGAGFQPYQVIPDIWCFNAQSIAWDPTTTARHDLFDSATVRVTRNGVPLNLTTSTKESRAWNWNGITWTFAPGQLQHGPGMGDVTYDVSIQNVLGVRTSYNYSVTVFDPVTRGSFRAYGTGCGLGNGLALTQQGAGLPTIGQTYRMRLGDRSFTNDLFVLNVGLTRVNVDLSALLPTCTLYVDPLLSLNAFAGGTSWIFDLPLPSDTALIGGSLFTQGITPDAAASTGGLVLSNGAELTIGG